MSKRKVKIGTRGSKLALVQARGVEAALKTAHPDLQVEIVEILTSGDWKPEDGETRLSEAEGGKGLFAKEIEKALLDGGVDCGVHSLKDMDSSLPEGLVLAYFMAREDPRDAFLSSSFSSFEALPEGAVVGTSSLRRQALLLAKRPDLNIVPLRGNVSTRIEKMKKGQVDATLLAMAGLKRLGLEEEITTPIEIEDMLPACGQGTIGIEIRQDDTFMRDILGPLHCTKTGLCSLAEREVLRVLDGSCHTPIGAYGVFEKDELFLRALVAAKNGTAIYCEESRGGVQTPEEAVLLGQELGLRLKDKTPPNIFS